MELVTVPCPEGLTAWLQEARDHGRAVLSESRAQQKRHYDLRRRQVSYITEGLVRVRTLPQSAAQVNFTASPAPSP